MPTITNQFNHVKQQLRALSRKLILSANVYVGLVIGSIIGGIGGGLSGLLAGSFIATKYKIFHGCSTHFLGSWLQNINMDMLSGAFLGAAAAAAIVGFFSALMTAFQIYQNPKMQIDLNHAGMKSLITFSLLISAELNFGVLIGAGIATLFYPGIGTVAGAAIGFAVLALITTLQVRYPLKI